MELHATTSFTYKFPLLLNNFDSSQFFIYLDLHSIISIYETIFFIHKMYLSVILILG